MVVSAQYEGWTIPPNAKAEKSPFAGSGDAVKKGKAIFLSRCQRCHGPEGKGNGSEADSKTPPANLTRIRRSEPGRRAFTKRNDTTYGDFEGSMPAFSAARQEDILASSSEPA
jgi:mono/diheme cytochrome c family protein